MWGSRPQAPVPIYSEVIQALNVKNIVLCRFCCSTENILTTKRYLGTLFSL